MTTYLYTDRLSVEDYLSVTATPPEEWDRLPQPESGWVWIQPPGTNADRAKVRIPLAWPHPAGLGTVLLCWDDSVEVRSSELVVGTQPVDVDLVDPSDPLRLFLSAFVYWPPGESATDETDPRMLRCCRCRPRSS